MLVRFKLHHSRTQDHWDAFGIDLDQASTSCLAWSLASRRRSFYGYFAPDGGRTAGPLLFPGCPGILDESCWRTARLWSLMSEPVVSPEGFTAGPLLLPGLPGIPAPEFCPLGALIWPPPEGAVVCAAAGSVTIASAVAPIRNFNIANSILYRHNQRGSLPGFTLFPRNAFADHFVPGLRPQHRGELLAQISWHTRLPL
jgi:hypothetical protein